MPEQYDDTNKIVLFKNNSDNPKAPDFTGKLDARGTKYRVALWKRVSNKGVAFLSGEVTPEDEVPQKRGGGSAPRVQTPADDLPW